MPERLIEDTTQTYALHRTQHAPGEDRPHVAPVKGPSEETGVGFGSDPQRILRALGSLVQEIRDHVHTVNPRPEDKDFSVLKQHINGDKKSDPPTGRITLDATGGENDAVELCVQTAEGFRGHLKSIWVRATDPLFDLKDLNVTITLRGTSLKVARVHFARPHVLSVHDQIVLHIANLAPAPVTVEYGVEGWLRRED